MDFEFGFRRLMSLSNADGERRPSLAPLRVGSALPALALVVLSALPGAGAVVVTDDFSDLNDTANPTWIHLDGFVASTGQIWDASSGQYRLHDPTIMTGGSTVPEIAGYGFVGSYVGPSFTDVRVSADIVDFVPPGFQSSYFAVAARLDGNNGTPTVENGLQLRGYSYQFEGTAASGTGEMVLSILHGDGIKDIGSFPLALDNSKDYRVVFEVVGNTLHGQVFELNGGVVVEPALADQFRDLDANPPNPDTYDGAANPEREFVPYTSGYSGVYGVGHVFYTDADFTIDNFRAESLVLSGDFDGDHDVDDNDLTMWDGAYGSTAAGDADGDGDSDGADFLIWQQNFTGSPEATAGGGAIPEPAAAVLTLPLLIAAANGLRRRRG